MNMRETLEDEKPANRWKGKYNDIPYKVIQWELTLPTVTNEIWNYYILPTCDRVANRNKANELWLEPTDYGYISYPYLEKSWSQEVWFHGGCTFYEKSRGYDGGVKVVELGCDYNHAGDTAPDLNEVLQDVRRSIDSFMDWCGIYLCRCVRCGYYFRLNEGKDRFHCGGAGDCSKELEEGI